MHVINTIINPQNGEIKYCKILDNLGYTISFVNNLIASLKGWASPIILTLLGPFRSWE